MASSKIGLGHEGVTADGTAKERPRRRGKEPDLPSLIERTNSLSLEDIKSQFLDPSLLYFVTGPGIAGVSVAYRIDLYTSSALPEELFNNCFDLLEANMSAAYRATSKGWQPRKKREEMKHPAMRYLILSSVPSPPTTQGDNGLADGSIFIGFLEFMVTEEEGSEVIYTYELDLLPSHQGLGLGKRLLVVAEEFGRRVGLEKAMLTVFDSNTGARRFYEREGYALDEISPDPKVLRNGLIKQPTYHILSKAFRPPPEPTSEDEWEDDENEEEEEL